MTDQREKEMVDIARRILPSVASGRMPELPEQIDLQGLKEEDEAFLVGYIAGTKDAEKRLGARRPKYSEVAPAARAPITHEVWKKKEPSQLEEILWAALFLGMAYAGVWILYALWRKP